MAHRLLQTWGLALKNGVTGISFRILLFNVLLIIITTILFLNLNNYEGALLHELELNQNAIGRSVSGNLTWKGDLTKKKVWGLVDGMMLTRENRIQVFTIDREPIYDSGLDKWDTGPDINEYRHRLLYRAALRIYDFLNFSHKQTAFFTDNPEYQPSEIEWERLRKNRGFSKIKRNISQNLPIVFYSVFPISERQKVKGIVIVSKSANRILSVIYKIRYLVLKFFLIVLIATIVLNLIISKTILKPIKQLTGQIGEISERNYNIGSEFASLPGRDEIAQLSKSFSGMTNKLKSEIIMNRSFIDEMVHEIKNPLTSIRSASEMADMAENATDRKMFFKIIADDVSRMENLLSAVNEISKINTSRTEKSPSPVDISVLTEKLVNNINIQTNKRIKVWYEKGFEYLVSIDKTRYLQVIENIIRNALSFSPEPGSIKINIKAENHHILVEIIDSGPGIPEIHLPRVFERFYSKRPEESTHKHNGIGLSIARSIIRNVGGDIHVSNQKNGGAHFLIQLPALSNRH